MATDTEPVYEKVFDEVRLKLLGSSKRFSCEVCVRDLKLYVTLDQFFMDFHELRKIRLEIVECMPGSERLIKRLHAHNVPICVAKNSGEKSVIVKTKKHQEVFKLFHHTTGTDPELKKGKPAPGENNFKACWNHLYMFDFADIFLLAASRFNPQADPKNVSRSNPS